MRHSRAAAIAAVLLLTASACSNRSDDADTTSAPVTTVDSTDSTPTSEPEEMMFGTLPSPCSPGDATIADGQNGGATLRIGTANDHGYEAAPGLTIEMLDAAKAFAGWCNEQGGIRGLQLEIADLDGKLFQTPPAMEKACDEVFAMVGGGWVFDDLIYPRFHECGMINFAGYTVSPTAAMSNGKIQPIPNPSNEKPASWLLWAQDAHPEAIKKTAIMYGDFLTTKVVADSLKASMEALGEYEVVDMIPYAAGGESNWSPFAQRLADKEIGAMVFVGAPNTIIPLYRAMREVGYVPELVFNDANFYDEIMVAEGNSTFTEGFVVRTAYAPFEEADDFPGMRSYLDMMETYNPKGKIAGLGLQATSAFLMFATAANTCLDRNDNVLERECVLAAGKEITSWTGGGLHTETNPGANRPPSCGIMMHILDGRWQRLFPEVGSADDNGGGWHCDDPGTVAIEGDFGDTSGGVDPTRPN
jgi:ABC-type branched-subunit amino acid transport system substrate-binding protein